MSVHDHLEPTNEELWPQPPSVSHSPVAQPSGQAMVPQQPVPSPATSSPADRSRFILAVTSMVLGIPISAIAAGNAGLPGLLIAWVAIVAVNFIYSGRRP